MDFNFIGRYHGNYCGSNWSNGTYGPSVRRSKYNVKPIDKLDWACKEHDHACYYNVNRARGDLLFAKRTFGRGIKSHMAGIAVGGQGVARSVGILPKRIEMPPIPKKTIKNQNVFDMFTPRSRGRTMSLSSNRSRSVSRKSSSVQISNLPGAYTGVFKGNNGKKNRMKSLGLRKGAFLQWENNFGIGNADALTIVHYTPVDYLIRAICYSYLRSFAYKHERKSFTIVNAPYGDIFPTLTGGCSIRLRHYETVATTTLTDTNLVTCEITTNIDAILNQMVANIKSTIISHPNITLYSFEIVDTVTGKVFSNDMFSGMKTVWSTFSSLSIQSIAESTGVNQNPNEVTIYGGKGNGPLPKFFRSDAYASFTADPTNGFGSQGPNSTDDIGSEPFNADSFNNCSKVGTCLLNNGEIKKSVLVEKGTTNTGKLLVSLIGTGLAVPRHLKWGNYKMYHFEGMISKTAADVSLDIEVNFNCSAITSIKGQSVLPETSIVPPSF